MPIYVLAFPPHPHPHKHTKTLNTKPVITRLYVLYGISATVCHVCAYHYYMKLLLLFFFLFLNLPLKQWNINNIFMPDPCEQSSVYETTFPSALHYLYGSLTIIVQSRCEHNSLSRRATICSYKSLVNVDRLFSRRVMINSLCFQFVQNSYGYMSSRWLSGKKKYSSVVQKLLRSSPPVMSELVVWL